MEQSEGSQRNWCRVILYKNKQKNLKITNESPPHKDIIKVGIRYCLLKAFSAHFFIIKYLYIRLTPFLYQNSNNDHLLKTSPHPSPNHHSNFNQTDPQVHPDTNRHAQQSQKRPASVPLPKVDREESEAAQRWVAGAEGRAISPAVGFESLNW